jgi:hypothetical protein
MKTHTLEWTDISTTDKAVRSALLPRLDASIRMAARLLFAAVPVSLLVVGAAWAITVPQFAMILEAAVWASGFLFLALAVESGPDAKFGWAIASGLVLPVLAVLSSRVAGEFLVVAAVVLATWVAVLILKRS